MNLLTIQMLVMLAVVETILVCAVAHNQLPALACDNHRRLYLHKPPNGIRLLNPQGAKSSSPTVRSSTGVNDAGHPVLSIAMRGSNSVKYSRPTLAQTAAVPQISSHGLRSGELRRVDKT